METKRSMNDQSPRRLFNWLGPALLIAALIMMPSAILNPPTEPGGGPARLAYSDFKARLEQGGVATMDYETRLPAIGDLLVTP